MELYPGAIGGKFAPLALCLECLHPTPSLPEGILGFHQGPSQNATSSSAPHATQDTVGGFFALHRDMCLSVLHREAAKRGGHELRPGTRTRGGLNPASTSSVLTDLGHNPLAESQYPDLKTQHKYQSQFIGLSEDYMR